MGKKQEYLKIRTIISKYENIEVTDKKGGNFKFPLYMNEAMGSTSIDSLELSVRSYNCLKRAGINTIGELVSRVHSSSDLMGIRNCGKTSIAEIMESLFYYQYVKLKPERQNRFILDVIRLNLLAQID